MSKCNKAKNPCKICLSPVTQKTGLKCQGVCQSWVHYSCLNYTPGKIRDIKTGIIKVTCPCPDCKTSLPKEFRTDQPFSCNNSMCPANQPPKCDNFECPTNRGGMFHAMAPPAPPCPLGKCGNQCKQFSSPHLPEKRGAGACPPPKPCTTDNFGGDSSSDACLSMSKIPKCPSGCSSTNDVSGDFGVFRANSGGSGSNPNPNNFSIVEQMCTTVGELTNQIKELMCQMKQASNQGGGGGASGGGGGGGGAGIRPPRTPCPSQGNPNEICPKPCYCPGNPARRM